jgi:hypothetical protein
MLDINEAKKQINAVRASKQYIHDLCSRIATRRANEEIDELAAHGTLDRECYDFSARYAWHYARLRQYMEGKNAE